MTALDRDLNEKALDAAVESFGDFFDDYVSDSTYPALRAAITAYIDALSSIPEQGVGVTDPKLVRYIEMLRHECAYKGPCSDNGDGCTCSAEALDERHMRALRVSPSQPAAVGVADEMVERVSVPYDGFTGDVIGSYTTREGKQGVVVQQDGTRVVHVYGRSRVEAALRSTP